MGAVYAARDERLDRDVAVKLLHADTRGSLLAEARAAARLSHPRSCQIFEIDTHEGRPFLVMELLTGETLAARLARGPLPVDLAIDTILAILDGLDALHRLGLVHRDLKPANVFLTPHGVKLVDFGLARPIPANDAQTASMTLPGLIAGTPHYMAPEQIRGATPDARSDIFSAGAMLFEAVTGRVPFRGVTAFDVLNAVLNDHPPSIAGSPALTALDRIVQRALAKAPDQRFARAADMGGALARVRQLPHGNAAPVIRSEVRVAVLPFRLLRPDPEIEFLALGLADAVSHSMAQSGQCLVRSPFVAARVAETTGDDLRRIGVELDIDVVMSGTLLRSGDRVRVNAQLVDCASGRVTWSHVIEGPVGDVFDLQDAVVHVAMGALPVPASVEPTAAAPAAPPRHEVSPRSAVAYRLFLRANQLAHAAQTWQVARDLYLECLREDPEYAPAWAQLGRMHRVVTKYHTASRPAQDAGYAAARAALDRALAIDPDLPAAHFHFAQLETDHGHSIAALRRLLVLAERRPSDPELYAGLVLGCRYGGLLDASLAADEIAHRLDPTMPTSAVFTFWARGEYERVLATPVTDNDYDLHTAALWSLGRIAEARTVALEDERRHEGRPIMFEVRRATRLILEGDLVQGLAQLEAVAPFDPDGRSSRVRFPDGEATYFEARLWAKAGALDRTVRALHLAVAQGYACAPVFRHDSSFDPFRRDPAFAAVMAAVEASHAEARRVFVEHQGPALLGVTDTGSW